MIDGLSEEALCQKVSADAKTSHQCERLGELRERAEKSGEADPASCSSHEVESDLSTESGGEEIHSEPDDEDCRGGKSTPSEDTLYIFDWDDTLFPMSWVLREGIQSDGHDCRSQRQEVQFREVARSAAALLEAAKRLGKVIVVTNAEAGWIEQCCADLLPDLAPALDGVKCISARSQFIGSSPVEPSEWKCKAFDREIQSFCAGRAGAAKPALQVISLGDSLYEQAALFKVARAMPVFRPKSVKLMENPTAAQLVEQHKLLALNLEDIFKQEGELDIEVGPEQTAQ
jgi:hypothetical protein